MPASLAVATPSSNLILRALSVKARLDAQQAGVLVTLVPSQIVLAIAAPIRHVYFPLTVVVALRSTLADGRGVHTALVGAQGMVGTFAAFGLTRSPWQSVVHASGDALRLDVRDFLQMNALHPTFRRAVRRFAQALMTRQVAQVACMQFHALRPRLAAWLLVEQAQAPLGELQSTHESLAHALGVRREAVTAVAGALAREGLIRYHRGHITVLDQSGLQDTACACSQAT
jgi:CRP-like cAMP-binding protein